MARPVICDAGPLIALAGADLLHLPRILFGTVWIPPAVRSECLAGGADDRESILAAMDAGWLQVRAPQETDSLSPSLGPGETGAIHLASEHAGSLLIVDDRLARRYALTQNIAIAGTVRLLWVGERRGVIESAEAAIRRMTDTGYRISLDLLTRLREQN